MNLTPVLIALLFVLLPVRTAASFQHFREVFPEYEEAERLTEKIWKIAEIRKEHKPSERVHLVLESPDWEPKELTLTGIHARILALNDVITLRIIKGVQKSTDKSPGDYLVAEKVRFGKTKWKAQRAMYATTDTAKDLKEKWDLFWLQRKFKQM